MHFSENLKVGDQVLVCGTSGRVRAGKVERLTKTLVIVNGAKFRKRDGREPGDSANWHKASIFSFSQERLDDQKRENARRVIAARLKNTSWRTISGDKLARIAAILEGEDG